tara:strand:- start:343 stop:1254 length:912 start_codon:yes stop_codon:yes gene_type:complete
MIFNKTLHGDCRETLKELPDKIVNTVITSPPYYGLRNYREDKQLGLEETPEEYVSSLADIFDEVWRVLRDDGTVWLNLGDSYSGSGKGIAGNICKTHDQQNMDGIHSKIVPEGLKPKDLIGVPWRVAFELQKRGWYLRQDIIWSKGACMPESVKDRCTKSHEYIFLLSKNKNYYYDNEAIKVPVKDDWGTRDRTDGKYHNDGTGLTPHSGLEKSYETANKRSVWTVNPKPYKDAHFATFPPDLIEPCVLAGCPKGGVVLDPFMGSGTTGLVAQELGRQWIGCELNKDYIEMQKIRTAQQTLDL